jgi:catechol 2,3-dioxygenase-like lactoylglutathione lyase family enzyme
LRKTLLLLGCFYFVGSIHAQNVLGIRDITDPESSKADALCGPLHTVTMSTAHLDSLKLFYINGMGMTLEGPINLSKKEKKQQMILWDLPASFEYELYLLHRPNVPENIKMRVLVVSKKIPLIHKTYNSREIGPFTLGFPNANQEGLDSALRNLGFTSMAPMQAAMLSKPDGSKYKYLETIYKAPDMVHVVGIERGNGMPQLAPYDPITLKGGPGYTAQVVTGISKTVLKFYTEVLGMEIRKDTEWKTGAGSALGIEEGVPFKFSIVYSKGATSGHLLFMDFKDNKKLMPNASPRLPNRGIGMYSFETKNIRQVFNKANDANVRIIQKPMDYKDPWIGNCKIMTMLAPNGVMVEVFQRK